MSDMSQLYQQVILDHAREEHGEGLLSIYDAESFQVNPTCGDEVRLRLSLSDEEAPRIEALAWQGVGCSISRASQSIMTDLVTGRTVLSAEELGETFRTLMHGRGNEPEPGVEEALQDAAAFRGVARYPARIKCALLGWMALRDALAQALTTEPPTVASAAAPEEE